MKTLEPNKTSELDNAPVIPRLAYSMAEAAELLGISYISVHRLLKRGLIRSSTALRTKVISRAELEKFLRETSK
jgi:excisionase family DNA binding protein